METGSVYRAKYQMKWVWFIPIIIMFLTDIVLKRKFEKPDEYWFLFIMIGVFGNFVITDYFITKIWKKIKNRYVNVLLKKVMNYHKLCITGLINEDHKKVKYILDKCLSKYDSSSIISHYILGANDMAMKDMKYLRYLEKSIKEIDM